MDAMLARIQNDLFDLGADLCVPEDGRKAEGRLRIADGAGRAAGTRDRRHERELAPLTSFVLPGGTALAAHLHLARAIARRAEAADRGAGGGRKRSTRRRCAMSTGCRIICS